MKVDASALAGISRMWRRACCLHRRYSATGATQDGNLLVVSAFEPHIQMFTGRDEP